MILLWPIFILKSQIQNIHFISNIYETPNKLNIICNNVFWLSAVFAITWFKFLENFYLIFFCHSRLQCFKSAWIYLILHEGLGFPVKYKHLTSVQYIEGEEIHWTLGALLYKTKYYPLRYKHYMNISNKNECSVMGNEHFGQHRSFLSRIKNVILVI